MARVNIILEHGEARAFSPVDRVAFKKRFANTPMDELLDIFEKRSYQPSAISFQPSAFVISRQVIRVTRHLSVHTLSIEQWPDAPKSSIGLRELTC